MTAFERDRDEVVDARNYVRRALGADVERKASDEFCALHRRRLEGRVAGLEMVALSGLSAAPATVIEFDVPSVGVGVGRLADSVAGRELLVAARALASEDIAVRPAGMLRSALVTSVRNRCYRLVSPVYDEIERLSSGPLRTREVLGVPQAPTLVTQICWLNGTVRTWAGPESLVEVAGAPEITGLDVPRRLMPDATRTHVAIGLPSFLAQNPFTGRNITVAVIDSEVALSHPALAGRVVHRRNYTSEPWGNPDSHGTAVAGIIGAADPNHGGVAPGVMLYNYKVLATTRFLNSDDFGGSLAIQQAVEDGVDLANCSWGAGPVGGRLSREARAVDEAAALGMATVKSAGNLGPGPGTMTTPADSATAVVVGATDPDGVTVPDYSARGPAGARPGPDVVAPGGTESDHLVGALVGGGFGGVGFGTSFAAPHVTGVLALLLEREPDLLPADLRAWVRTHARPLAGVDRAAQGEGLLFLG